MQKASSYRQRGRTVSEGFSVLWLVACQSTNPWLPVSSQQHAQFDPITFTVSHARQYPPRCRVVHPHSNRLPLCGLVSTPDANIRQTGMGSPPPECRTCSRPSIFERVPSADWTTNKLDFRAGSRPDNVSYDDADDPDCAR
jgi:hypothetical protein